MIGGFNDSGRTQALPKASSSRRPHREELSRHREPSHHQELPFRESFRHHEPPRKFSSPRVSSAALEALYGPSSRHSAVKPSSSPRVAVERAHPRRSTSESSYTPRSTPRSSFSSYRSSASAVRPSSSRHGGSMALHPSAICEDDECCGATEECFGCDEYDEDNRMLVVPRMNYDQDFGMGRLQVADKSRVGTLRRESGRARSARDSLSRRESAASSVDGGVQVRVSGGFFHYEAFHPGGSGY